MNEYAGDAPEHWQMPALTDSQRVEQLLLEVEMQRRLDDVQARMAKRETNHRRMLAAIAEKHCPSCEWHKTNSVLWAMMFGCCVLLWIVGMIV